MDDAAVRLERSKDSFKDKVKGMLEAFLRETATMQEEFSKMSPTSHENTSSRAALGFIAKWKAVLATARQKVCGRGAMATPVLSAVCEMLGQSISFKFTVPASQP